mmetsp:Transcript_30718/g.55729  ORF Transcript_30718/g.55729 Transcript_30718/m.55729 type:complete len:493 (+) Transcript_30718:42-1520(+)
MQKAMAIASASPSGKATVSGATNATCRAAIVQAMQLEVHWMASGEMACLVETTPSTSEAEIRAQVCDRINVPVDEQRLFAEGHEIQQELKTLCAAAVPQIQLVRSQSDPRNTDLAHFSSQLSKGGTLAADLEQQLSPLEVGRFSKVRKVSQAIYGEVSHYRWSREDATVDVAVKSMPKEQAETNVGRETNEWAAHLTRKNMPNPEDALIEIGVLAYLSKQPDLPLFLLKSLAVFMHNSNLWVVTEFAEGGELLDAALSGCLQRKDSRSYMWEILQAVKYLHSHQIGHRDISLENLLLKGEHIRLMDFGAAVQSHSFCGQELRYFQKVGKETYRAPECYVPTGCSVQAVAVPPGAAAGDVIMYEAQSELLQVRLPAEAKPGLTCQADLWGYAAQSADIFACGVCFFCLCYGNAPWTRAQLSDAFFRFIHSSGDNGLQVLLEHWRKPLLEPEAMHLLLDMLRVDPTRRPSAVTCLQSSWLAPLVNAAVPRHADA